MKLKEKARLKLAEILKIKFEEVQTETVVLQVDGELEIGSEVFIYNENGELAIPADGDYTVDEKTVVTVEGGIVTDIAVKEDTPEEPEQDEVQPIEEEFESDANEIARIESLESQVAALVEIIKEITGVVDEVVEDVEEVAEDVEGVTEEFNKVAGRSVKKPLGRKKTAKDKRETLSSRFFGAQ